MTAVAPARECAFAVIRRVFEQGAYADRALHGEAAGLTARDRQLAMALAYGTVQRKRTLDHILGALCARPLRALEGPVLAALRLGCFQLLLMDGVAEHAAVNDSVELAKRTSRGGAQLVNAVLRRTTREARELLAELDDATPAAAAVLHSVPDWLTALWWEELGPVQARALLASVNQPAESALRVNTLRAGVEEVRKVLEVPCREAAELPEGLVLDGPLDAHGSALWRAGAIMPQSRGSMLVARALAPRPGQRVLDLCAAPGAKTTHLAALIGDHSPDLRAVEVHPGRARALRATCARMGTGCVQVVDGDAREPLDGSLFDRVLVDPPCSGLGTLQSRPDLRWQARRAGIPELARKQGQLLAAGANATASGGVLVYSLCTISRAEADGVIDSFLCEHHDFELDARRQLLPHRDGTDGFFIARLRRA
ncbi:MAG: 16S rRNA (cytosine(967)-C(5))-methyltransferase RsmB [Solirubrobacteraceae bacterium]